MTLKELSQLYHLNMEIERETERLEELWVKAQSPSAPQIDGLPSTPLVGSRLERCVAEIVDLSVIISEKIQQCIHERNKLERYIANIDDSLTRQIFTLRFVNGMSWTRVAEYLGGNNSANTVSKTCYRYLKKNAHK
jgi:hypothetical protein